MSTINTLNCVSHNSGRPEKMYPYFNPPDNPLEITDKFRQALLVIYWLYWVTT